MRTIQVILNEIKISVDCSEDERAEGTALLVALVNKFKDDGQVNIDFHFQNLQIVKQFYNVKKR
tara:strand:- start:2531 stop:2722 length:192 start_codon:yes stop_codon:yes gene_type:complete